PPWVVCSAPSGPFAGTGARSPKAGGRGWRTPLATRNGGRRSPGGFVDGKRYLIVAADDFGIGPATSQGILDLAVLGRVTATVLLVNSPYAEPAVRAWRQAGQPVELGWHPCLTLDRPVLPPEIVPSL